MKKLSILEEINDYKIIFEDIEKIEKIKNCELPLNYKNFLLKHNGGRPGIATFDIQDNILSNGEENGSSINWFYGICLDKNSIMCVYDIFYRIEVRDNRIPKELIPIAGDSFGNEICLCIQGENYGKVYFWDHENEVMDPKQAPWWENIYLISDSFTEFLEGLYDYDIDGQGNEIRRYQDGTITNLGTKDTQNF
ncbi:MAG: SMI1/KNR4 family protein [Rickettsia endosymbiont of Platyusa sonomae]|nr:SMI1/KNR4 family protein [Rickettsia endosymbiont of Platyusa sonomae]